MNTAELDAWFARADDVLTDWTGSADAMDSARPEGVTFGELIRNSLGWSGQFVSDLAAITRMPLDR